MAKSKSVFFCQSCGYQAAKWLGNCPSCGEWNTFVEEVVEKNTSKPDWKQSTSNITRSNKPIAIDQIEKNADVRIDAQDDELNRVLGGGIVPGSIVLIGGEPGIGKSTLLLQVALQLKTKKILYISGEES